MEVIPFNLQNLRKHLAEASYARRVLSEDVASRQKILEESVYDVAMERWKHDVEKMEELGLGTGGLRHAQLQSWMFDWAEKMKHLLKEEIMKLRVKESEAVKGKTSKCAELNHALA